MTQTRTVELPYVKLTALQRRPDRARGSEEFFCYIETLSASPPFRVKLELSELTELMKLMTGLLDATGGTS